MENSLETIGLWNLAIAFLPVAVVIAIFYRWSMGIKTPTYALSRMLMQLLLIGYVLNYIFAAEGSLFVVVALSVMLLAASWISLRPVAERRRELFGRVLIAIAVGGLSTLLLITQGVLQIEPWYNPRQLIPLGGMIFSSNMNAVSLAAERFVAETQQAHSYEAARRVAMRAALIPLTNSLFAAGLVSLPGMMTGQILSGVSPLVAARYQIMVMFMWYGSAGISVAYLLASLNPKAGLDVAKEPVEEVQY